jgi:hypothetical protein
MKNPIYFIEKKIVYGILDVKQYYTYVKKEFERKHRIKANRTKIL